MPLALLLTPAVTVGFAAAGLPWWGGVGVSLLASLGAALSWVPRTLSTAGPSRFLPWLWGAAVLAAAYMLAHQSAFMYDVSQVAHAYDPPIRPLDDQDLSKPFYPKHNCFTSYVVGAYLAREGAENIYDPAHYRRSETPTPLHEQIEQALGVDRYQYPPPFLILPRALLAVSADFYELRAYWHALNTTLLIISLVVLLRWIDRTRFHVYWLVLPALFLTPGLRGALQIQNVHVMIIAISVLALPAFDARKNWLGGALLGFAVVSKLFPGLLLVFLFLQRRWRAFAWTISWMAAFVVLALMVFGTLPFRAFAHYQMPRLASGEAFSFATTMTAPMLKNSSIVGVPYKFGLLDLAGEPERLVPVFVWGFTLVIIGLLVVVGLRRSSDPTQREQRDAFVDRLQRVRIWLAILVLGQLRSPFLPSTYGNLPVLMLLLFLLVERPGWYRNIWVLASFILLSMPVPLPWGPMGIMPDVWFTLVGTILTLLAVGVALLQRPGPGAAIADE